MNPRSPHLHRWWSKPVLGVVLLVAAAGFGQFGAVAALGDVAEELGEVRGDATLAEQAGLSGTALGIGLAIIRLASLLSLPLAGLADRLGRRKTTVAFCAIGLAVTATAAVSPTFWWFVAIFALSRPLLTATDTIGEVAVAEQTASRDRAKAVALVAAGFGVGAGLIALVRGVADEALGFRGVFILALVPLVLVLVIQRWVIEPDRFRRHEEARDRIPVLAAVGAAHRRTLGLLIVVVFAVAMVTGPANSFFFLYAENILGLSASVTAALVIGAGLTGLLGLLLGRWGADRLGRRPTAAVALVSIAAAGILTYSGSVPAVVIGYLSAVMAGSVFAPAAGALHAELFPTAVRAATAGWLVVSGVLGAVVGLMAFGAVADAGDRFGIAAIAVFIPAAVASLVLALIPETRGRELESLESG